MADKLRIMVGVMANANSLLLYSAPILTFLRVLRKRSTEEFSCVPYILALMNCLLYTWYGLPLVSNKWENFLVVSINGLGILLEISFILIYFWFASSKGKIKVAAIALPVILVCCVTAVTSVFAFEHSRRKLFVGSVGLFASVAMYAGPLVVMKKVIQTKSVEFMPFYLSFFSFLASVLWLTYGLLGKDIVLASPNLVGLPLGILQLAVYFKYRNNKGTKEVAKEWEMEKKNLEQLQIVVNDNTTPNGKS